MINKRKYIIIAIIIIAITSVFLIKNLLVNEKEYNQISFNEISVNFITDEDSKAQESKNDQIIEKIKVHITGQVVSPGLIELEVGSRIYDAIELAGGLTEDADTSKTNLAYILSDGEKIYIPSFEDEEIDWQNNAKSMSSKVNINTANQEELEKIPGVGESTANSIIEYREKTGKYTTIEDIMNVSGIGQSKFEKMKDYITVK